MSERWTPEAELILAKAVLRVAYGNEGDDGSSLDDDWAKADAKDRVWVLEMTKPMLAALADAGLLLPPGGEVRGEYRDYTTVGGGAIVLRTLERARA